MENHISLYSRPVNFSKTSPNKSADANGIPPPLIKVNNGLKAKDEKLG